MKTLLALCLLLCGCGHPTDNIPPRQIAWQKSDTPNADCVKAGMEKPLVGGVSGCSFFRGDPCLIIAPDAPFENRKAMATLGEEFKHCYNREKH